MLLAGNPPAHRDNYFPAESLNVRLDSHYNPLLFLFQDVQGFMLQLLEAISYVHERKIAHLDIKVSFQELDLHLHGINVHFEWLNSIDQKRCSYRAKTVGVVFYGVVVGISASWALPERFALA